MSALPCDARGEGGGWRRRGGGSGDVHARGHAHAESNAVRWTGDEEFLHSQPSGEAAGASLGAWLPDRLPKYSDPTLPRAHALLHNARQGAAAVSKLAASIAEAKESIYNAQGDYLDDINLWQDAQDQYLDVMDAYASLGESAAGFDAQIKELSAAYAQLSVPPQRQHIKST